MSAPHMPPAGAPVRGWTAARTRRTRLFIVLLAGAVALAIFAVFQPWYGFSTAGPIDCAAPAAPASTISIRTGSGGVATGVAASGCITGRGIAVMASAPTPASIRGAVAALGPSAPAGSPAAAFGIPLSAALVVLGALLGAACLVVRNGWFGAAGFGAFYYAHGALDSLQSVMMSGIGGQLNTPQRGLDLLGLALLSGWAVTAAGALFVIKHNREQRKIARAAALAAGQRLPAGPLDQLGMLIGGKLAAGMDAARANARHEQAHIE